MRAFKHHTADSVEMAVGLLIEEGQWARVIAGGTDLIGTMKDSVHPTPPTALIDLKRVPGLDDLTETPTGLVVGAMVRLNRLEKAPLVKGDYGLLSAAASTVASPQIRNMGTIAGNICQEPRCWYYRYPDNFFDCLRKSGRHCPALIGENRFHSVFGAARIEMPPCVQSCPASTKIPDYLRRLRAGDWDGAAKMIMEVNPMPAVTGRVCPHFCQNDCNRREFDSPVSIRSVERCLGDFILDHADRFMVPPQKDTGRSAAIIGAGPAGLTAAFYLRRAGHSVTVFDRLDRVGGMLTNAIPAYRLPRKVVQQHADAIKKMGVMFRLGVELGRDLSWLQFKGEFDAVFVATGAWGQPTINIEGENLAESGLSFLQRVSRGDRTTPGPRVLVIGGGNVAIDVGLTAKRLGATEVILACLEHRVKMPAHHSEIEQAEQEGICLKPAWGPKQIVKTDAGLQIDLIRCTAVFDEKGDFSPTYDDSIQEIIEVDQVFLAVGQLCETNFLDSMLLDKRGMIVIDSTTQATDMEGVYAGGDAATGPASVIEAIAAGGRAAAAIATRLGRPLQTATGRGDDDRLDFDPSALDHSEPVSHVMCPIERRTVDGEDVATIGRPAVLTESNRCFNCGCVAVSPADIPPALVALQAVICTNKREIPAEMFFRATPLGSTVLEAGEIVTLIRIPKPPPEAYWSFEKFRRRKAIDFPIASVAVNLVLDGGKVREARIVLGAVAPVPIRARKAEAALLDRELTREAAEAAAEAALQGAMPLRENGYKLQVIKALVRRNVLSAASRSGELR
jgi:NADPH-dependent glutamate synthase beta subunit-like oxidoreductase